jgi:hypothetical protein
MKFNQLNLKNIAQNLLDPLSEEIHPIIIFYLVNEKINKIKLEIEKYFLNPSFKDQNKMLLLEKLKIEKINHFFYVRKRIGKFKFNPINLPNLKELKEFNMVKKILKQKIIIDSEKENNYEICLMILNNYFSIMYPILPKKEGEINALSASIYYKACLIQFLKINKAKIYQIFNYRKKFFDKFNQLIKENNIF